MVEVAPSLWWQAIILLAYTSGLRRTELWHLRWQDFDADAGTIRVQNHDAGRYTVNGTTVPILEWTPKTKGSVRTVPIPPQTVAILQRLRLRADGSPYIFVGLRRLMALDAKAEAGKLRPRYEMVNNFTRGFSAIQDAAMAKLQDNAKTAEQRQAADNWRQGCFHDLRKTFGTRAATSGVPMHELQRHMGHSQLPGLRRPGLHRRTHPAHPRPTDASCAVFRLLLE